MAASRAARALPPGPSLLGRGPRPEQKQWGLLGRRAAGAAVLAEGPMRARALYSSAMRRCGERNLYEPALILRNICASLSP